MFESATFCGPGTLLILPRSATVSPAPTRIANPSDESVASLVCLTLYVYSMHSVQQTSGAFHQSEAAVPVRTPQTERTLLTNNFENARGSLQKVPSPTDIPALCVFVHEATSAVHLLSVQVTSKCRMWDSMSRASALHRFDSFVRVRSLNKFTHWVNQQAREVARFSSVHVLSF